MTALLPQRFRSKPHRVMVFVDGENLSIRYGALLAGGVPKGHVSYIKDTFVWSEVLNKGLEFYEVVRKYYYTSALGDEDALLHHEEKLRSAGIEAPRVFKKAKGRSSKRVDVALVTDLLLHAFRDNYDIAILISGDEDFVPAVKTISAEGKVVVLWAMSQGLSPALKRSADFFFDLDTVLLVGKEAAWKNVFHS